MSKLIRIWQNIQAAALDLVTTATIKAGKENMGLFLWFPWLYCRNGGWHFLFSAGHFQAPALHSSLLRSSVTRFDQFYPWNPYPRNSKILLRICQLSILHYWEAVWPDLINYTPVRIVIFHSVCTRVHSKKKCLKMTDLIAVRYIIYYVPRMHPYPKNSKILLRICLWS